MPNICVWEVRIGNSVFSNIYNLSRRRKNPENKKCKILDKRCFNVQRHHPNRQYHLLDLKTRQKHKDFALISGRVGDISDLGDVSARWSTVCQEFYIFYFRVFSYDLENSECIGNAAHYTSTPPATWPTKKYLHFI